MIIKFFKSDNYLRQQSKGFTLVESIVAIFILLISVVMPMAVVARALFAANYAQDQITAVYLAQEAIEVVRNTRDNNVLGGTALWDQGSLGDGSSTSCYSGSGCYVDSVNNTISACAGVCPNVQENSSGAIAWYGNYGDWTNTKYVRTIKLSKISAYEIKINSTVTWASRSGDRTVFVEDVLTNWP